MPRTGPIKRGRRTNHLPKRLPKCTIHGLQITFMDCPVPSFKKAQLVSPQHRKNASDLSHVPSDHTKCVYSRKNARLAACKWNSTSKDVLCKRPMPRIQPNNLWPCSPHSIWMTCPLERTSCEGGCASFVRVTVLCAFKSKPVAAKSCMSKSSNKTVASWVLDATRRISSANFKSKSLGHHHANRYQNQKL